ncbi:MAG: glycosyltransferase family 39 protein [Candidatus Eisenbacteria bacterium]|uniref:Glycosyltransferase family 39 protein n=1 Tax=Eiseniibacteriota bacterium TaxID=2212470 RepID=A0A538TJE6_UNCEI|nr:MAG: glycosyltransferase family 39 protein [Candidatus Eisenbacteria bacterium]
MDARDRRRGEEEHRMSKKRRKEIQSEGNAPGEGLRRAEWGIAIAVCLLAVLFHIGFLTQAGALWRDEVNTAEFARMASVHEIYSFLKYDGFPPLVALLVRGWATAGGSSDDLGLRVFGFAVGLAFLGALWLACRSLRSPTPLFSLALIGLNPVAVRAVDSIRPYGLGMVLIVATMALVWRAIESPSAKGFVGAGILAVLSVQCMYQNAFLLVGICAAGAVVSLRRADLKTAGAVVLVGAVAALSLLPYRATIAAAQSWNVVIQSPTSAMQLLSILIQAVSPGGPATAVPWLVLAIVCGRAVARSLRPRSSPGQNAASQGVALFSGAVVVASTAAFLAALASTKLQTQPWYYVPLLAILAPALDAGAWAAATTHAWKIARLVLAAAIAAAMAVPGWAHVTERRTNADIVASLVGTEASAQDLIVVNPWYYGVSFRRYYKGTADWTTLPPLEDLRIHRYDLLKAAMARSNPIDPVLEKVTATLKSGHRLWLIGVFPDPRDVEEPAVLPPAPHASSGWYCAPYIITWGRQISYLLKSHVLRAEVLPTGAGRPVNPYENLAVVVVSGWR